MDHDILTGHYLWASLCYAGVGTVVLFLVLWLFDRLTPFDLWKEIIDEHNTALAILMGCLSLGISLIIAAAIHG